jgi:hypothetical protein
LNDRRLGNRGDRHGTHADGKLIRHHQKEMEGDESESLWNSSWIKLGILSELGRLHAARPWCECGLFIDSVFEETLEEQAFDQGEIG